MSDFLQGFIVGAFLGGVVGVFVAALCVTAARADRHAKAMRR